MKKSMMLLAILCALFSFTPICSAQEYHAVPNIIKNEQNCYMYNDIPLFYTRMQINNIWWTGKEYLYLDYESEPTKFKKSLDMKNWDSVIETEGLFKIRYWDCYTYDINYWGDKYVVFNRMHENVGNQLEFIDRKTDVPLNKVWILDENFNLVNEISLDIPISAMSYVNGKYYLQTQDCTDYKHDGNPINIVYVSDDAITWTLDETLTEVPLYNDGRFSMILDGSLQDGKAPYLRKIVSVANNDISERTKIEYENLPIDYFKQTDDMYVSYSVESEKFKISLDGVYWLDVLFPEFLKVSDIRPTSTSESKIEYILDFINLKEKILFQTQYRLFEYDKEELRTAWYNAFGEKQTYVKFNGTLLGFEASPIIESDRTLVPMRFLFEQMGADVTWNQERKEATATMGETVITFGIDNTTATVNSEEVTMDVPARLINDKTMVPLRFLSENMGYNVDWDSETRTAVIEK